MVEELRSIPPPEGIGVANVDDGAIYDDRLPTNSTRGSFETTHDFHGHLRNGVEAHHQNAPHGIQELITFHERLLSAPVLTHAHRSSFRILVRGDEVVGVIDWECAAWFPPYLETYYGMKCQLTKGVLAREDQPVYRSRYHTKCE